MSANAAWPVKSRELHNHHFDSTIWNDLRFRGDDIIIATYAKSGTTWMQQMVAQMLYKGDPNLAVAELSPWMDLRVPPKQVKLPQVEAQTQRRMLKRICPWMRWFTRQGRNIYILEYCSFDWMKKNATKSVPLGGAFWDGGAEVFINKDVNGRWADTLTADESAEYESRAVREVGPECARWLATGEGQC